MGCASSQPDPAPTGHDAAVAVSDDHQRKLMRRTSSKRISDGSSRTSNFFERQTPCSTRETVLSSYNAASSLVRSRSGTFASPRGRPPQPMVSSQPQERRTSVGYLAEAPPPEQLLERIAEAVAQAKALSVREVPRTPEEPHAAVSYLNAATRNRICDWCDDCIHQVRQFCDAERDTAAAPFVLPGQPLDELDVESYILLSPLTPGITDAGRAESKLTAEALRRHAALESA